MTKLAPLLYRAYELTITDGVVTSKRQLDRGAGDTAAIQAARGEGGLWDVKEQDDSVLDVFETV